VIAGKVVICQAKEMVSISKSISMKVKEKQGDITDDEVGLCVCVYFLVCDSVICQTSVC